jgi:hypothetical protein
MGPATIQQGSTQNFNIDFAISTSAPLGTVDVTVLTQMSTPDVDPPPSTQTQVLTFEVVNNAIGPTIDIVSPSASYVSDTQWNVNLGLNLFSAFGLDHAQLVGPGTLDGIIPQVIISTIQISNGGSPQTTYQGQLPQISASFADYNNDVYKVNAFDLQGNKFSQQFVLSEEGFGNFADSDGTQSVYTSPIANITDSLVGAQVTLAEFGCGIVPTPNVPLVQGDPFPVPFPGPLMISIPVTLELGTGSSADNLSFQQGLNPTIV